MEVQGPSFCSQQSNSDPCAQLVHTLMCYHQGGEDPDFICKAIEGLVKKLKDRREQLDTLISAITSGGKQPTNCVTIHRSLDGRLQVAGRKGVPNVVYARIWRWPKVNKTELIKLAICTTPSEHPDLICINPYHYDRIVSSGLPNFESSSLRMDPLPSTSAAHLNESTGKTELGTAFVQRPAGVCDDDHHRSQQILAHLPSGNTVAVNAESPYIKSPPSFFDPVHQQQQSYGLQFKLPKMQNPPKYWCSIAYFEGDSQVGGTFKAPWSMEEVLIDGGMDPAGADTGRFCLGALSNVHRSEASERARLHIGKGVQLKVDSAGECVSLHCLSQKDIFVRSHFLDFQHGLQPGSSVHKFCSGAFRKVFDLNWAYAAMCEQNQSAHLAAMAQAYAVAGIAPQPSGVTQNAGTNVDDMRRACCTIAFSFVKGWGKGYSRGSIKDTPCWIQLYRPLQLLNELLSMN